jgi:hypothetical protein
VEITRYHAIVFAKAVNLSVIELLDAKNLQDLGGPDLRERAIAVLENGGVLHLPQIGFEILEHERALTRPQHRIQLWAGKARSNARPVLLFNSQSGRLHGINWRGLPVREIKGMMGRFAAWSRQIVDVLLPEYAAGIHPEFTTSRPANRSVKQPLHMDAIPRRPTQGRAMLRVFSNVNDAGLPRVWNVGGHFRASAEHFAKQIRRDVKERIPGTNWALARVGFRTGPRTAYDRTMLRLRELIFTNKRHQRKIPNTIVEFPAGSTWIALTDVALHSAHAGQFSLDQTFLVDPAMLRFPERSSLHVLQKLTGRKLV